MFSILQDPCDSKYTIFRDDTSGFYSATRVTDQFHEMNPGVKQKQPSDWMRQVSTKILIAAIKEEFNLDKVSFTINGGIDVSIRGTYIHPVLYTQYMSWVDTSYLLQSLARLHELNNAQGDIVLSRIGEQEKTSLCSICQYEESEIGFDEYCKGCFEHTFPKKTRVKNFKSKEQSYMLPLKEIYPDMILDKTIVGGCSKRRPDGFIELMEHSIIVEIDEHQHRGYDAQCENRRMMQISEDLAHRPIVFIRLNPDNYRSGKQKN